MDHKELDVWKESIELVVQIYSLTNKFPKEEMYGLTSQLRRAAVSVPANIAEGAARNTDKAFVQFLYIAIGSLAELETLMVIAQRLGYHGIDQPIFADMTKVKKMALGLVKYLKQNGK